jgi:DNA-binding MarR family transcriptional regulator
MNAIAAPPKQLEAWVAFLRSHSAVTRQLNVELLNEHGLTLNDYEVMMLIDRAEHGVMRRVDLAESVLLTASGITRLLDGLEAAGYVEKAHCQSDARVSYAKLTEPGREKLRAASATHLAGVEAVFASPYTESELATLAGLLSRLPMTGRVDCSAKSCG